MKRKRIGNPTAMMVASNPELIKTGRIFLYFAIGLVILVVAFIFINKSMREARINKSFAESTIPGNEAYFARQIWDAGGGKWYDMFTWGNDDRLLQIACEIGKEGNYQKVASKFQQMYDTQLTDYVSSSLNSEEMIEFDKRATGQQSC